MNLYILEKDDSWVKTTQKMKEENNEAIFAINVYIHKPQIESQKKELGHYIAEELLDIIQVSIGALDKLNMDGLDISEEIKTHNDKLKNRGWRIKGTIRMNANYSAKVIE